MPFAAIEENFALRFVRFYHFISARDDKGLGADFFINVTDQVQNKCVLQFQNAFPIWDLR